MNPIKDNEAIDNNSKFLNTKINPIPKPDETANNNLSQGIADDLAQLGQISTLDISKIDKFTQISRSRNELYKAIDIMCEDSTISAVLETYAEDATEYNEDGKIVWAESNDSSILQYINFLLDSLQIDKHIYSWVQALCKYGDIYIELFKQSDYKKDTFFTQKESNIEGLEDLKEKILNEDIDINIYAKGDHYVHYVEMFPDPAEMFELTKFGKTAGFIKTSIDLNTLRTPEEQSLNLFRYSFKKDDINIYNGDKFIHASLENNKSRVVEQVELFKDSESMRKEENGVIYRVKKGESLFYNVYKIWRLLSLLENSMVLNRVTKSSIIRVVSVETGDIPKEEVAGYLRGVKQLMEQKASLDVNNEMGEYNNPGPVENNVYIPTHDGKGAITTSELGGNVDVGKLADVDYINNKFFGAMRIPKQYFGLTEDGAGFNGGQSLSIISSRYAKMIKRIQKVIMQLITDIINMFLIDKGMSTYIGKFKIKMQSPTTQEELDRRENLAGKVQLVRDVMELISQDVESNDIKLKILKELLSTSISNSEITQLIEDEINKIKETGDNEINNDEQLNNEDSELSSDEPLDLDSNLDTDMETEETESEQEENEPEGLSDVEEPKESEEDLPTPQQLGNNNIDFTNNNQEI